MADNCNILNERLDFVCYMLRRNFCYQHVTSEANVGNELHDLLCRKSRLSSSERQIIHSYPDIIIIKKEERY